MRLLSLFEQKLFVAKRELFARGYPDCAKNIVREAYGAGFDLARKMFYSMCETCGSNDGIPNGVCPAGGNGIDSYYRTERNEDLSDKKIEQLKKAYDRFNEIWGNGGEINDTDISFLLDAVEDLVLRSKE